MLQPFSGRHHWRFIHLCVKVDVDSVTLSCVNDVVESWIPVPHVVERKAGITTRISQLAEVFRIELQAYASAIIGVSSPLAQEILFFRHA